MLNKTTFLKIKIKSLAEEAKIIRHEEAIAKKASYVAHAGIQQYDSLRNHRVREVREEQRATLLAYGYLRGRAYSDIERDGSKRITNWVRVQRMVEKYGTPAQFAALEDWVKTPVVAA